MADGRSAAAAPTLRGRHDERAVLDGLLEGARAGRSGALVLRGESGIGKTALLEHAVEAASDLTVLRAVGVEPELELAFGALHQVCAPILERLDGVPAPQRDALRVTFGLSEGRAPDRFMVGLATLSLLSEAAERRPVLCVVDDAQWLDRASAQALAFAARRLLAESVVMLFGAREPGEQLAGLPDLVIRGLQGDDARQLLASMIPGRLDDRVADQLIAEARGNPLALLELPRGLSPARLAGGFGWPGASSVEGRIEASFLQQLDRLPHDTRRGLLVAAADPLGDRALLWHAIARLGIERTLLEPAESAMVLEIDGRVRFRHPLVRSAVYRTATAPERREAHRALAESTDAAVDPDYRVWHLAQATAGPDDAVAGELEQAAARAQARGGVAAAGAFLERAAALTSRSPLGAKRALAAARLKYQAGALHDALALVAHAEAGALDDLERARALRLRAQIAFASSRGKDAPPLLLRAARELEALDVGLSRATYLEALAAARFVDPLSRGADLVEISEAALAAPAPPQRPRPPDLLLRGWTLRCTQGDAAGAPILKEALSAFRGEAALPPHEARWVPQACQAASDVWDDETWRALAERELERVRATGALTALPWAITVLSWILAISGEVAAASSLLGECRAATDAAGIPRHPYVELWVVALRGREAELSQLVQKTKQEAIARGEGFALAVVAQTTAVMQNALGRYGEALAAVRDAVDVAPFTEMGSPRISAELIEAAVRSGERRLAERGLDRLSESARAAGADWALGVEARSRALLADDEAADGLYREAIERLRRTSVRLQLARTHLLYGEWLRRERRRENAREQLRTALEMFTSMGTEAFAARAEGELLATGERVRRRNVESRDDLTAQEAQIARLARDGLSNAEIGERLFISQHTVAYHLRKVFAKLDITSRNQLGAALRG